MTDETTLSPVEIAQFEALYRRGTDFLLAGNAGKSLPLLQNAHKLDPHHFQVALNLGSAYILQGQFKKAIPILEALRTKEIDNAHLWQNLGAAYLGNPVLATQEMQTNAIIAFEKSLDINPVAPNVAYNIALIYRDQPNKVQAIHWFTRAIQADPTDTDARRNLARLQENNNKN